MFQLVFISILLGGNVNGIVKSVTLMICQASSHCVGSSKHNILPKIHASIRNCYNIGREPLGILVSYRELHKKGYDDTAVI